MKIFDRIYIGTGPISVIDAAMKKTAQNEIILLDEKEQVGGAWVAIKVGEYGELEIGCHIWSYNKGAYDFMQHDLALNLKPLTPQPYFVKGKTRLIYDHKNAIGTLKRTASFLKRFNIKGLRNYYKTNPAARLGIIPKQYLYPAGGARDVQQKLVQLIAEKKLKTALQTTVTKISKQGDNWALHLANGTQLLTKTLALTATSSLKEVVYGDIVIKVTHRDLNYTHFHIVIEGEMLKPVSYIRVLDDKVIHRISDITYQLEEKTAANVHVILVGVFDAALPQNQSEGDTVQGLVAYLVRKKIVAESATVLYAQKNKFETTYISEAQRKEINELNETIEVMATTDLMYGIHSRLPEWKPKV